MLNKSKIYFDKMLQEYYPDSCIFDLFKAIVNTDSNYADYPPSNYFYSLYFSRSTKGKAYQYLAIAPRLWKNSEYMDYTGVIKINKIYFLCIGDFETDFKFHKINGSRIRIKLVKNKSDSLGNYFIKEPSLHGAFNDCKGLPTYIEVYIKRKITYF